MTIRRTGPSTRARPASSSSAAATSACTPRCACRRSCVASRGKQVEIIVVDPRSYMTYQPFLPEAAAGSRRAAPRRRAAAPGAAQVRGAHRPGRLGSTTRAGSRGSSRSRARRTTSPTTIVVVAPGSIARTLPIPGLAEQGIGFKTVEEAIELRNHVLEQARHRRRRSTDHAAAPQAADLRLRRRRLRRHRGAGRARGHGRATRPATTTTVQAGDMRCVLVEATGRILPEVGEDMGRYTVERAAQARHRRAAQHPARVRASDGHVVLSDGERVRRRDARLDGRRQGQPGARADRPAARRARAGSSARPTCGSRASTDAWAAGDCAARPRPHRTAGRLTRRRTRSTPCGRPRCSATTSSRCCAGSTPTPYGHKYVGSVACLGLHKGVAQVYGIKLRGFPAWFMHRTYHVSRVPTFNRKVRVVARLDAGAVLPPRDRRRSGSLQRPARGVQRSRALSLR